MNEKRLAFETIYARNHVTCLFDMNTPGVVLADTFRQLSKNGVHAFLEYSRGFKEAYRTKITDDGVEAFLTVDHGKTVERTYVPWEAVAAVLENTGKQLIPRESWDPHFVIVQDQQVALKTLPAKLEDDIPPDLSKWTMAAGAEG